MPNAAGVGHPPSARRLVSRLSVMARSSSPARLVVALSVAAVLAVFLLYTSLAGGGTPSVSPRETAIANLSQLNPDVVRKVLHDNAARVYHLD